MLLFLMSLLLVSLWLLSLLFVAVCWPPGHPGSHSERLSDLDSTDGACEFLGLQRWRQRSDGKNYGGDGWKWKQVETCWKLICFWKICGWVWGLRILCDNIACILVAFGLGHGWCLKATQIARESRQVVLPGNPWVFFESPAFWWAVWYPGRLRLYCFSVVVVVVVVFYLFVLIFWFIYLGQNCGNGMISLSLDLCPCGDLQPRPVWSK